MKKITLLSVALVAIIPATIFAVSAIGNLNRKSIGNEFPITSDILPINPDDASDKPDIGNQGVNVELLPSPPISPEIILLNSTLGKDRFKNLGWWGQINAKDVPVMSAPSSTSTRLAIFSQKNRIKILEEVFGETIGTSSLWYKIDGGAHPGAFIFSANVMPIEQPDSAVVSDIPSGASDNGYWVDVDLTKKVLTLFLGNQPVFSTYVSTGRKSNPTLAGTFKIWTKLEKTRMRGRPPVVPYVYDLKNVPHTMYYRGSYALHGTYWHDEFGTQRSAGCTNLTQGDAKFLFERLNVGDVVYNHY